MTAGLLVIDLNCDMGEGAGNDELIMPFISSANIACGYHAGDQNTMQQTIELATEHEVAIGAHVSFDDKPNFGRKEMNIPQEEMYDLVQKQLIYINTISKKCGAELRHVKPHGALYNMAARDVNIAATIAKAVKDFDQELVLFGLSGSHSISEAKRVGLKTAGEVFADRTYQDDGSLTPRSQPHALIEKIEDSLRQTLQMIREKKVTSASGKVIPIIAETICIHGDGRHAVEFARNIYLQLKQHNIVIKAI